MGIENTCHFEYRESRRFEWIPVPEEAWGDYVVWEIPVMGMPQPPLVGPPVSLAHVAKPGQKVMVRREELTSVMGNPYGYQDVILSPRSDSEGGRHLYATRWDGRHHLAFRPGY